MADRDFPFLAAISSSGQPILQNILDTGLFKLSDAPSLYEPVHRIVAEYAAASYFSRRINDKNDQLSLRRCLSIIAPNNTVRDELRGLLGWLAALGNQDIQTATLDLDPYAVLANGDPARLSSSSKKRLLAKLNVLAQNDPYFRRSDVWRNFSIKGFFTEDTVESVKPLLLIDPTNNHLPGLLLELLQESDCIPMFEDVLEKLLFDSTVDVSIRIYAGRNLLLIPQRHHLDALQQLVEQGGESLRLAVDMVEAKGVDSFGQEAVLGLLKQLVQLYPEDSGSLRYNSPKRYFISPLIRTFDLDQVVWFLEQLSQCIRCTCSAIQDYQCKCRNGISKIIGKLLDRYFEFKHEGFDAGQIWSWTKALNFDGGCRVEDSSSVAVLKSNNPLRQAIHLLAFDNLNNLEALRNLRFRLTGLHAHSGLSIQKIDLQVIVDHAFNTNNALLWTAFFQWHMPNSKEKYPNELRAHMRLQAKQCPELMRIWSMFKLEAAQSKVANRRWRIGSRHRRTEARNTRVRAANLEYLNEHRAQIESGQNWDCLVRFADYYIFGLKHPTDVFDDIDLIEKSLQNCFPFLENDLPSLNVMADLACNNRHLLIVRVLFAACLAVFRKEGTLASVKKSMLTLIKAGDSLIHVDSPERESFEAELNRFVFESEADLVQFARSYLEPQLTAGWEHIATCDGWLEYRSEFAELKNWLPFEWLARFPLMSRSALTQLFNLCARDYADKEALRCLIAQRCADAIKLFNYGPLSREQIERRNFWFIRSFFFTTEVDPFALEYLRSDQSTIFVFEQIMDRHGRYSGYNWPALNAEKIYTVLDVYVDAWPKVDLPDSCGSDSPPEEVAYRFLTSVVWRIGKEDTRSSAFVFDRLLQDQRFKDFHPTVRHLKADAETKRALQDFEAPDCQQITNLLDKSRVASVEDLRALLLEKLTELQVWLQWNETDPLEVFYSSSQHVDENTARNRIVEFLQPRLNPLDVQIPIERNMASSDRCDFTAETSINGRQNLLVIEVKGQWHRAVYTAAQTQLYDRYAYHPNAARQGIYLVLWFGIDVGVAGKKTHIKTAQELKSAIEAQMSSDLLTRVNVFVLDLTRA